MLLNACKVILIEQECVKRDAETEVTNRLHLSLRGASSM